MRLWLCVLGAVMAVGLAGQAGSASAQAGSASAQALPSHRARHHGIARVQLTAFPAGRRLPAPRPAAPARGRSSRHAAVPQLARASHHRAGVRSWDYHALGAPSHESRRQDAGHRLARASGILLDSKEHPVISGRGPPLAFHFRLPCPPVAPISASLIPPNPNPTAVGPSRDPGRAFFVRASARGITRARVSTWSNWHKGLSHGLCRLASRWKGAVAGCMKPLIGGVV